MGGTPARREAAILAAAHAFRRTHAVFHRRLAAATGADIPASDLLVLQFLAHAGQATPKRLMAFTGLTSGSTSLMLDRLERAGLVTRTRASDDRRSVTVRLVPGTAQKLMASMLEAHAAVGRMFEGWTVGDIEQLVALLERLQPPP